MFKLGWRTGAAQVRLGVVMAAICVGAVEMASAQWLGEFIGGFVGHHEPLPVVHHGTDADGTSGTQTIGPGTPLNPHRVKRQSAVPFVYYPRRSPRSPGRTLRGRFHAR